MSRTIKAIERHMVPPSARSDSANASAQATTAVSLQRKAERKLRVVFAPLPLTALTTATK
jgi:hypothetical protein